MKFLTISRFAWVAFARRFIHQIAEFPLLALFGIAGIVILGAGLIKTYRETVSILSILPESLKYASQYRIISAMTLVAFTSCYLVLTAQRELARDRTMLMAAPVGYSALWFGTNSVALVLLLTGLVAVTLPLMLAILNTRSLVSPLLSWLGALTITLVLNVRGSAIALCVWSWVRFLKLNFRNFGRLGILLEGGPPILIGAVLGWPLAQMGKEEVVGVDPAAYVLTRYLVEPSMGRAVWATGWLLGPTVLAAALAYMFLNRANEVIPISTRESLLSQYTIYTSWRGQFIACEIKRFVRERRLLLGYIFSVSLLLVLAYFTQKIPDAQDSFLAMFISITPYVSVMFPLLTLSSDVQSDWVFRSTPLSRLTYLTLKLIAAAIISGATSMLVFLGGTLFGRWQILPILIGELLVHTLGLTGVAFMVGGILRQIIDDVGGQVFAMFLFFMVSFALQYGVGASIPFLSTWGGGMLFWLILFAIAPLVVQAWETAVQQNKP